MMKLLSLLVILLVCSSCAEVKHLDEALALKAYSDEGDSRDVMVAEHDRRFEQLVVFVKANGSLRNYQKKVNFVAVFGEPILVQRQDLAGGRFEERLLYRYMTRYFDGPKVYVFFDDRGEFLRLVPIGFSVDEKKL